MKQHPRPVIFWWAALWLIGLLFSEASHGVLHRDQAAADGGAGICAVCILHNAPAPLVADTGEISIILPRLSGAVALPQVECRFLPAPAVEGKNSRAPPVSFPFSA